MRRARLPIVVRGAPRSARARSARRASGRAPGKRTLSKEARAATMDEVLGKTKILARWRVLACLAITALGFAGQVAAAVIPFQREQVSYDLKDEPLKDFLERFFAEQNLQAVVSPLVANQGGTLNGPRSGTPEQVFRSIAASNQLTAYYDGGAV